MSVSPDHDLEDILVNTLRLNLTFHKHTLVSTCRWTNSCADPTNNLFSKLVSNAVLHPPPLASSHHPMASMVFGRCDL